MTRRERLERKLERRREWADKAHSRSTQAGDQAHRMLDAIPFGQPILVGHHSEKADRNYRDRAWNKLGKAVEQSDLANHHESKADGLERQLDKAIYDDDTDAVEALEARIAERQAERDKMKQTNALYRKGDIEGLKAIGIDYEALKARLKDAGSYWGSAPHLPYELTNIGATIRNDQKRLEAIKARNARSQKAQASVTGVLLEVHDNDYCNVTFAEKPEREILNDLRAAGFWWGKGSWAGKHDKLPESVKQLLQAEAQEATYTTDPDNINDQHTVDPDNV